jgi:hypothetical protein
MKIMKERIQVDGIWYVRETSILPIVEIKEMSVTNTLGCIWESDNWCFEATAILRDEAEDLTDIYNQIIDIVITDKRSENRDEWIEHDSCDNSRWFIGVLEGDSDSMEEADEMLDAQGIAEFRGFISHLIDKGWIVKE